MKIIQIILPLFISTLALNLSGCSTYSSGTGVYTPIDEHHALGAEPVVKSEPLYKWSAKAYTVLGKRYYPLKSNAGFEQTGPASWYGPKFHGRKTSIGEIYNMYDMTAAHKTLLLPAYVEVTNLQNRKKVIVRVNDRGPFHGNRIIDLSYAAAKKLDIIKGGTAHVHIRVLAPETKPHLRPTPALANSSQLKTTATNLKPVFLQAGVFSSINNADALKSKIKPLTQHNVTVMSQDGNKYSVQVGPVNSVADAEIISAKLASHNIDSLLLID